MAYALELYNEDLRDLAHGGGRDDSAKGWDIKAGSSSTLKLQERPVGKDARVVPEVGARLPTFRCIAPAFIKLHSRPCLKPLWSVCHCHWGCEWALNPSR